MKKKELGNLIDLDLPQGGQQVDGHLCRPAEGHGLRFRHPRRNFDFDQGHDDSGQEGRAAGQGAEGSQRDPEAVQQRRHHRRRALQQGGRHLGRGPGPDRIGGAQGTVDPGLRQGQGRQGSGGAVVQPDFHHGRFRRARIRAADSSARRIARPDGQAVGRDHRDSDHGQLPRRADRVAVLHLDPRRAQGTGRYGAQDRQLGLPDAPAGRRGAGLDHHRRRLRHARRNRDDAAGRRRRGDRGVGRPGARTGGAGRNPRSVHQQGPGARQRNDRRGQGGRDRRGRP